MSEISGGGSDETTTVDETATGTDETTVNETVSTVTEGTSPVTVEEATVSSKTGETTQGSTETVASIETAQGLVESHHQTAIDQIREMYGNVLHPSTQERLDKGIDSIKVVENDPNSRVRGGFSHHNGKDSITVTNISKAQLEATTTHETNHFASFNRELVVPAKDNYTVYKTSGVREASWTVDNKTGNHTEVYSRNRGMNEGLTCMYTNAQLEARSAQQGLEAARQNGYVHATELCQQLEASLGKETLEKAYYGGDLQSMREQVDVLGGKGSFESLSRCMDTVTYTDDPAERMNAMYEAQEILARIEEGAKKK